MFDIIVFYQGKFLVLIKHCEEFTDVNTLLDVYAKQYGFERNLLSTICCKFSNTLQYEELGIT